MPALTPVDGNPFKLTPVQGNPFQQPDYKSQAAKLIPALTQVESRGNVNAVSKAGARGAQQVMPATAKDPGYGVKPAKDNSPTEQQRFATDYLAAMLKKFNGDETKALQAYNAGPGRVDSGKPLPLETQQYPGKVLSKVNPIMAGQTKLTPVQGNPFQGGARVATTPSSAAVRAPNEGEISPNEVGIGIKGNISPEIGVSGPGATLREMYEAEKQAISNIAKPIEPSKTLAEAINKGPVGRASDVLYGGLMAPLAPVMQKAEQAGAAVTSDDTMEKVKAILNIFGIAGIPGLKGVKSGEIPKVPVVSPEVRMAEIETRMDKGEIPREQAHAQMEELRKQVQPKQETIPEYTPHPNEVKMAQVEAAMDRGEILREQAMTQMDELQKGIPPKLTPVEGNPFKSESKIFTPDEGVASTKELASTRGVADRLFAEKNRLASDQAELQKWIATDPVMKELSGNTELQEKFQKHQDNPNKYPLSPKEQKLFDGSVGVIRKEREAAQKTITQAGFKPEEAIEEPVSDNLGGATRQVIGKGTPMDRLLGIKSGTPVSGRSLSKSSGSMRPRNMMALDDGLGNRTIVHVTDSGDVIDASNKQLPSENAPLNEANIQILKTLGHYVDENGIPRRYLGRVEDLPLQQATIEEIEQATGGKIPYHKNALGVEVTSLLQERRAARNIKLLQELPKSAGASDVMRTPGTKTKNIPQGWVEIPNIPVFRGYHFEPEFAEEIQDHLNAVKKKDGLMKALESTNNFMKSAFFWLNPAHAYNVAEAFAVSKGALGFVKDLPSTASDFVKSLKSVVTRDKMYIKGARAGVPYRGLDSISEKFNRSLLDAMGERARQDPKNFTEFAKEFGFNKPIDLIKRVAEISHDIPFGLQDVLQQTLERGLARRGATQAQATEEIARTLPDYRTKSRYLGSRTLGQASKGSAFLQFPGWDIGRLTGLANMLKGAAKLDTRALDQLLMIAVLYEFGSKVIDPIIQQETGNPAAEGPTAGYGSIVKNVKDVYEGDKSPFQAAQALFPFGYLPRAFLGGINTYTGKQTSLPGESPKEVAYDYGKKFIEEFDPIKRFINVVSDKSSVEEEALRQIGVKSPSYQEQRSKIKAKKYLKKELAHKRRKEPDWIK